jgi:hypothetical protein
MAAVRGTRRRLVAAAATCSDLSFFSMILALHAALVTAGAAMTALLINSVLTLSAWKWGFFGVGLLWLPAHHAALSRELQPPLEIFQNGVNFFLDIANIVATCGNAVGNIWNMLIELLFLVAQNILDFFGFNIFPWARDAFQSEASEIASFHLHVPENAELSAHARRVGRAFARTARYVRRDIDVKNMCDALSSFSDFAGAAMFLFRDGVVALIEILDNLVSPFVTGDFSFWLEIITWLGETILELIAPCFTPVNEFPEIFFTCACRDTYPTLEDVPSNIFAAALGCICPGTDLDNPNPLIGVVRPCLQIDLLQSILDALITAINFILFIIDEIGKIAKRVISELERADGLIESARDTISDLASEIFERLLNPFDRRDVHPDQVESPEAQAVLREHGAINKIFDEIHALLGSAIAHARNIEQTAAELRVEYNRLVAASEAYTAEARVQRAAFEATRLDSGRMCGLDAPPRLRIAERFTAAMLRGAHETVGADAPGLADVARELRKLLDGLLTHLIPTARGEMHPAYAARAAASGVDFAVLYNAVIAGGERVRQHYVATNQTARVEPYVARSRKAVGRGIAYLVPEAFGRFVARTSQVSERDMAAMAELVGELEAEAREGSAPGARGLARAARAVHERAEATKRSLTYGAFGVQGLIVMLGGLLLALTTSGLGCIPSLVGGVLKIATVIFPVIITAGIALSSLMQSFVNGGQPSGFELATPWLQNTLENYNGGLDKFNFEGWIDGAVDIIPAQAEGIGLELLRTAMCIAPFPLPPVTCPPQIKSDGFGLPIAGIGESLLAILRCNPSQSCLATTEEGFLCRCPSDDNPDIWRTATADAPCLNGTQVTGEVHCWLRWPKNYGFLPMSINVTGEFNCDSRGYWSSDILPTFNSRWWALPLQYIYIPIRMLQGVSQIAFTFLRLPIIGVLLVIGVLIPGVGQIFAALAGLTVASAASTWLAEGTVGWLGGVVGRGQVLWGIGYAFQWLGKWIEPTDSVASEALCIVIMSPVLAIDGTIILIIGTFGGSLLIYAAASGLPATMWRWAAAAIAAVEAVAVFVWSDLLRRALNISHPDVKIE